MGDDSPVSLLLLLGFVFIICIYINIIIVVVVGKNTVLVIDFDDLCRRWGSYILVRHMHMRSDE